MSSASFEIRLDLTVRMNGELVPEPGAFLKALTAACDAAQSAPFKHRDGCVFAKEVLESGAITTTCYCHGATFSQPIPSGPESGGRTSE